MRKRMAALFVAAMIGLAAGNASAMMGGKGMMHGKGGDMDEKGMMAGGAGGHFMKMVDMLELTADQKKAVQAIHFSHRKEQIRKEADIDVAEVELQEIMSKEPVKIEDAEKKIRAIAAFRGDLEVMHLKMSEAVKAKLTPEQIEKLKKHIAAGMKEKMEEKGMAGMEMGGGMMGGKSKNCGMMGGMGGSDAKPDADKKDEGKEGAAPAAKTEEKKVDHSAHH